MTKRIQDQFDANKIVDEIIDSKLRKSVYMDLEEIDKQKSKNGELSEVLKEIGELSGKSNILSENERGRLKKLHLKRKELMEKGES